MMMMMMMMMKAKDKANLLLDKNNPTVIASYESPKMLRYSCFIKYY